MPPLTALGPLPGGGIDGHGSASPRATPEDFLKNFRGGHIDPGGQESRPPVFGFGLRRGGQRYGGGRRPPGSERGDELLDQEHVKRGGRKGIGCRPQ